ncbi:unnamed protein product [Clonostachys rosea f. rosea IK726]|uniref:Uncharacterized protein n=1 Tax=Clonostachys rosea f. rosea IK726 TaxID=1349383 RepID=A0ACA9UAL9_BIOOC|nr:unnamed protein product [Clonostachys rosea f. rosea IK726]
MRPILSTLPEMFQERSKLSGLWQSVAVGDRYGESWETNRRYIRRHNEDPKGTYDLDSTSAMALYLVHAEPSSFATSFIDRPACARSRLSIEEISGLLAKQQALCLLKSALEDIASADVDVILAVVLLLVGFELIDSGRGNWIFHIHGARIIIEKLIAFTLATETALSPLRSWLVSNCLVYDLLGSSFANSYLPHSGWPSTTTMSLLQDAEGNHCSSFPAALLPLIQTGAQLLKSNEISTSPDTSTDLEQQKAFHLLHAAKSFDPAAWAINLQPRSPADDLLHRTEIASAHKAAVCVYLSRIILTLWPGTVLLDDLEMLAAEIIAHLSNMRPGDALFTATAWPAFIAGLETVDLANRDWVVRRFQELWEMEPWGLTREALGALETIWDGRKNEDAVKSSNDRLHKHEEDWNWIQKLHRMGTDWLIA